VKIEQAQPFGFARKLARHLLEHLGKPDATHLIMNSYGRRFVCGRCPCLDLDLKIYNWEELVSSSVESTDSSITTYFDQLGHYIEAEYPNESNMDPQLQFVYSGYHRLDDFSFLAPEFYSPVHVLPVEDKQEYADSTVPRGAMPWWNIKYACLICYRHSTADLVSMLNHQSTR
jgi:hypothetical protein